MRENFLYSVNTDESTLEIVKSYTPLPTIGWNIFNANNPLPALIVGEAYTKPWHFFEGL